MPFTCLHRSQPLVDVPFYSFLFRFSQIEALKAIGVTEVVLAINYQPEVMLFMNTEFVLTQETYASEF